MDMSAERSLVSSLHALLLAVPFVRKPSIRFSKGFPGAPDAEPEATLAFRTPDGRRRTFNLGLRAHSFRVADALRLRALSFPSSEARRSTKWLVFAPYVDPKAARTLVEDGHGYLDLQGNCHLSIDERYVMHIEKPGAPTKPAALKGWRPASYRVLFALLANPENVPTTVRALAERAGGVSPQTASDTRAKLLERGIMLEMHGALRWADGGYRRALELWTHGFTDTLLPALLIGSYRAKTTDPKKLEIELAPQLEQLGAWAWGGGAACERLTGFYRGDTTVIYLETLPHSFARELGLVADPRGPIRVMRSPGPATFLAGRDDHAVHPVLAYGDLLAESEPRADEGAAEIYTQYLQGEPAT